MNQDQATGVNSPLWLLAELTYRCPLHCPFCYNATDFAGYETELDTASWIRVFEEARSMGAVQLGFSGGEPLLREDLEELVAAAHRLGYYTNLITSGVGLTETRIAALKQAGLDHIQLSFQDSEKEMNNFISNTKTFELKHKVAALIKKYDYPMVMNCVMHRYNLPHVTKIMDMAIALGAEYLELANTQFYGWAMLNREQLLPSKAMLRQAEAEVNAYRELHGDACKILFVVPDYYEERPKACMNGWGSVFMVVTADGYALPCHNARELPGLTFPNVKTESITHIWRDSEAFQIYRGDDWMHEPCKTCDEREKDFGGCRCQAYLLTGDAQNADPVCSKSPEHAKLVRFTENLDQQRQSQTWVEKPLVFRSQQASKALIAAQFEEKPTETKSS